MKLSIQEQLDYSLTLIAAINAQHSMTSAVEFLIENKEYDCLLYTFNNHLISFSYHEHCAMQRDIIFEKNLDLLEAFVNSTVDKFSNLFSLQGLLADTKSLDFFEGFCFILEKFLEIESNRVIDDYISLISLCDASFIEAFKTAQANNQPIITSTQGVDEPKYFEAVKAAQNLKTLPKLHNSATKLLSTDITRLAILSGFIKNTQEAELLLRPNSPSKSKTNQI